LGPIESILEAIGWRSKKVASLESFFIWLTFWNIMV
jgi:hypothetical protein